MIHRKCVLEMNSAKVKILMDVVKKNLNVFDAIYSRIRIVMLD